MTGQEFINSCMYDVGKIQVLTTDTNLRTIILDWLNRVLKDIGSRERHWYWLEKTATFATVANQMTYDLPSDINGQRVISVRQKDTPAKLIYVPQRELDILEPKPDSYTGNPLYYTLYANDIRLFPVPSDAYTMYLRYMKTIIALTDSASSTTDIPPMFDEVILNGVKVHAYKYFPQWGNFEVARRDYEGGIINMKRDNDCQPDDDQISAVHADVGLIEPYRFDKTSVGS